MGSWPLDLGDLLSTLEGPPADATFHGLPDATVMGHVHLRIADVAASEAFYRDVVGFDLMAHLGDQATFLSAGGYHHHLGGNTWESRGADPAPEGSATLHHFTIVVPDAEARDALLGRVADAGRPVLDDGTALDPSGNRFRVVVDS
jgi:catechol 2,3-dioxygenase